MPHQRRRYRIVEVVGQGAAGTVYRAEYVGGSGFRRQLALKILRHDATGTDAPPRLRDEARMLGRIRHRAIVNVDDLVCLDDRWAIVMDYVEACDVYRILREVERIPPRAALQIAEEVASALHVAYTWTDLGGEPLRLLHRDLKPSNVLVSAAGETTVVDFGVARADTAREAVSQGATLGSLGYVAPERAHGIDLPAGDVFSLGVLLYEMVSGRGFGRALTQEQHAARVESARQTLRVPAEIADLVFAMVAFDAEARPSAKEVRRRCSKLARPLDGPTLADWAEEHVPRILERVGTQPHDDLVGRILTEHTPTSPERSLSPTALPTLDALIEAAEDTADSTDPRPLPRGSSFATNALRVPVESTVTTQPLGRPPRALARRSLAIYAVAIGATVGAVVSVSLVAVMLAIWAWMGR